MLSLSGASERASLALIGFPDIASPLLQEAAESTPQNGAAAAPDGAQLLHDPALLRAWQAVRFVACAAKGHWGVNGAFLAPHLLHFAPALLKLQVHALSPLLPVMLSSSCRRPPLMLMNKPFTAHTLACRGQPTWPAQCPPVERPANGTLGLSGRLAVQQPNRDGPVL